MTPGSPGGPEGRNFSLIQQQRISAEARLDRQLSQLTRLNRLSNAILARRDDRPVAEVFAEAVVDVLDVGVGAVWVLERPGVEVDFAVCGAAPAGSEWAEAGPRLAASLGLALDEPFLAGEAADLDPLPGLVLRETLLCRSVGRDGTTVAVLLAANPPAIAGVFDPLTDDSGAALLVLAEKCSAHLDQGLDRRLIELQLRQLRESEERLALVLAGTNDGWWDWDLHRGECLLSARWLQMVGRPSSEPEKQSGFWASRVHPDDRVEFDNAVLQALGAGSESVEREVRLRREDDSWLPVLVRGRVRRDAGGRPSHFAGSIQDLSERKRQEAHIHQLAFYDPLTELPNRRLLADRLQQSLLARIRTQQTTAVLMLDLDRFKQLNDTHGHAAGDQLLRSVARRLTTAVRRYDTVARLGGDEFVVLLENLGTDAAVAAAAARHVAEKVLTALRQPYSLDVGFHHHTASIGIALATTPEMDADTLLKHADVALYQAKASGRNTACGFLPEMQARVASRSAIEARLRSALDRDELVVKYQAQVDAHGHTVGAEALLRWYPPEGPAVPPADFIPVAEDSGLIHPLGAWSLAVVCRQLVAWRGRRPPGFRVAVNVSTPEFLRADFTDRVMSALAEVGEDGSALRLEITEVTAMRELGLAATRIRELQAFGVELSLDDFGTGYSSLSYLRGLPVNEVKIDRSYVRRFLSDPHDAAIVRAVLALGRTLKLNVVAEGVETAEQWHALRDEGCPTFQGFLFGRPRPPTEDPSRLTLEGELDALSRGARPDGPAALPGRR